MVVKTVLTCVMIQMCFRSIDCRGAVRFATDLLMSPEQCVHIGWNAELVSSLLEFIERLRDIHIDVVEFCLLNAIVLTYPGLVVCLPHCARSLENHCVRVSSQQHCFCRAFYWYFPVRLLVAMVVCWTDTNKCWQVSPLIEVEH